MNKLLSAVVLLALTCGIAAADVPDAEFCIVSPNDTYLYPRVLGVATSDNPRAHSGYANIDVYVKAAGGVNIANAFVEVIIDTDNCTLCWCDDFVTSGYTDTIGHIQFNMRFGGCCELPTALIIRAEGVVIRSYDMLVSPDQVSSDPDPCAPGPNCAAELDDFALFTTDYFAGAQHGCNDYDGDDDTDLGDFAVFTEWWFGGSCAHACP